MTVIPRPLSASSPPPLPSLTEDERPLSIPYSSPPSSHPFRSSSVFLRLRSTAPPEEGKEERRPSDL